MDERFKRNWIAAIRSFASGVLDSFHTGAAAVSCIECVCVRDIIIIIIPFLSSNSAILVRPAVGEVTRLDGL